MKIMVFDLFWCIPMCFINEMHRRLEFGIFLPKLSWPTVRKNCSSDWEILLKFGAEGREFTKNLRSLRFIWTVQWKVRTTFGYRILFKLIPGGFSDLMNWNKYNSDWKKLLGFSNMQKKFEKSLSQIAMTRLEYLCPCDFTRYFYDLI